MLANESAVTASATVTAASGSAKRTEKSVAKVGDLYYDTLAAAFSAITTEGTVELLADVTLSDKITIQQRKNIVLDLGSYTINAGTNFSPSSNTLFRVWGTLTIQGSGKINAALEGTSGLYYAVSVEQTGTIVEH